jgi:hypothetical protein
MQLLGSTPLQAAVLVLAAPCCKQTRQSQKQASQVLVHQHQRVVFLVALVAAFPMQQLVL